MKNIADICNQFDIEGKAKSFKATGDGHINDTYLVETENNEKTKKYILQRINHHLFTDVERLMNNIVSVTEFQKKKIRERGESTDRTLTVIFTKLGKPYYFDGESYYRMYNYIDGVTAYSKVEKPVHFYESAVAFGNFANLLSEFDASTLYESLPNFHNTVKRFEDLLSAIKENKANRIDKVREEIDFALKRKELSSKIVDKINSGEIPIKVTHNDTKLNNVLIDNVTGKAVTVVDYDTIMPGTICYDFGDAIRFGCNTTTEEDTNFDNAKIDLYLFEEYVRGYFSALNGSITKSEAENLALGAIVMTYECGMRFLTDYLNGDTYFKIKYENSNLDRARVQFALVEDMEKHYDEMNQIVSKYYKE